MNTQNLETSNLFELELYKQSREGIAPAGKATDFDFVLGLFEFLGGYNYRPSGLTFYLKKRSKPALEHKRS